MNPEPTNCHMNCCNTEIVGSNDYNLSVDKCNTATVRSIDYNRSLDKCNTARVCNSESECVCRCGPNKHRDLGEPARETSNVLNSLYSHIMHITEFFSFSLMVYYCTAQFTNAHHCTAVYFLLLCFNY